MILYINTADQKKVIVALYKTRGRKAVAQLSEENEYGSQVLVPLIEKLLNQTSTPGVADRSHPRGGIRGGIWEQLEGIEVETGPGSFTGIRVGVSVANALGFALGILVNGKKIEDKLVY